MLSSSEFPSGFLVLFEPSEGVSIHRSIIVSHLVSSPMLQTKFQSIIVSHLNLSTDLSSYQLNYTFNHTLIYRLTN